MYNIFSYFKNKKIDYKKLIDYGFCFNNDKYIYEVNIMDDKFKVIIEISKEKQISKVIDLSTKLEYLLINVESKGEFNTKLKEEYESIINDIVDKCTMYNLFNSKQTKEIIKYIKNKYNDDLEYLWKNFPTDAIWRNKKSGKWYGLLLVIEESKLGINSKNTVEIIDLRYQKDNINKIIDNKKIFGGYHMNKNSWITIKLDGSVDIKEIYKLIDNSYSLSNKT